jgi:8-oxo-dGTP diphosphatase
VTAHRLAVYLVLRRGDEVLFGLRQGTGYRDGEWGLPSGKLEAGERLLDAMRREAKEEIGLDLDPASLRILTAIERDTDTGLWLDVFYECDAWEGDPANGEPDRCAELAWLRPDAPGITDYVAEVLQRPAR